MLTTSISIFLLLGVCLLTLISRYGWSAIKALPKDLRAELHKPEKLNESVTVEIVGFSKLWFRKQFPIIDKELQTLEQSTLRTGLIAVREEFDEDRLRTLLAWQARSDMTPRLEHISMLHHFSQSLVTTSALLALGLLFANMAWLVPEATATSTLSLIGSPLAIIIFALAIKHLLIGQISSRLERNAVQYDTALQLCIEGILMLHQHLTPAVIRATLEAMNEGLQPSASLPSKPNPSPARFFAQPRKAS